MSEWISCPKCGALMIGITAGHICPLCGYRLPVQTITTTTGTSAEYVPVIRCKDCKHRITANCERFGIKRYTQSDSFCSWAEPKGDKDDR